MDIEVIRPECLKLALASGGSSPEQVIKDAGLMMDFVANGKFEEKSGTRHFNTVTGP